MPADERVNLIVLACAAQGQDVRAIERGRVVVPRIEVAHGRTLRVADGVVHFSQRLMFRIVVWNAVLQASAGIRGHGNVLEEIRGNTVDAGRIDSVVDEPAGERNLAAGAGRRREGREIAVAHRRSGHEAERGRRIAPFDLSLIPGEKKHPVAHERTAHGPTHLIALQAVPLGRKEVPRVEPVIPHELEHVSADAVRAGLGDDVDRRRRVVTVAGRQCARLDFEFLDGVGKRRRKIEIVEGIVMGAAIHDVRDAIGLPACHGDRHRRKILVRVEVSGRRGRGEA